MKNKLFTISLVSFLLTFSLVSAQIEEINVNAGITPDSTFYGIDKAIDQLRLRLSNNPNTGLRIAQERLAELSQMISENKIEYYEEIQQSREKAIERARNRIRTQEQKENFDYILNSQKGFLEILGNENIPETAKERIKESISNTEKTREKVSNIKIGVN